MSENIDSPACEIDCSHLTRTYLEGLGSLKWAAHPGTLAMWLAEMDFPVATPITEVLTREITRSNLGYIPPALPHQLKEAVAAWYGAHTAWTPDPAQLSLLPDVLSILRATIDSTDPGTPVIVPTPSYMPFRTIPPQHRREVIEVPGRRGEDGRYTLDLDGIAAGFAAGAQLLILCNPWNPTGTVFTADELRALAEVVAAHGGIVFSDEIHAPLVLEGTLTPYASVSPLAASHTITGTAASKGWSIPGLKCAQAILPTENNMHDDAAAHSVLSEGLDELRGRLEMMGQTLNTLGARASLAAFSQGEPWRAAVLDILRANRDAVQTWADATEGVRVSRTAGTYISWIDFSELLPEGTEAAAEIRERAGISLTPGSMCASDGQRGARMVFATAPALVAEALDGLSEFAASCRA